MLHVCTVRLHRIRLLLALAIGLYGAVICWAYNPNAADVLVDVSWALNAARDLLAGRDPYRHEPHTNLIPYPLPAALVIFPFALIPGSFGIYLFFGLSSALLAYGLLRTNQRWRLLLFFGPGFVMAALGKQWTPLLMAALYYPWLAFTLVAKPTLSPPILLAAPWSRRSLIGAGGGGALIIGASFLLMPDWPWRWLDQVQAYSGFVPFLTFLGPVLALAFLRIRDARARLLLLMAIVPQQHYFYDQILLWAIPQTLRQMLLLTIPAWIALFTAWILLGSLYGSTPFVLVGTYLPALLLVLFSGPQRRAITAD
jgi:hypothetical protein